MEKWSHGVTGNRDFCCLTEGSSEHGRVWGSFPVPSCTSVLEFWGHCTLKSWWLLPCFLCAPEEKFFIESGWSETLHVSCHLPLHWQRGQLLSALWDSCSVTVLLQQKRACTENLVFFLLPNTAVRDGWKWGKRKEGRWSSAIPLCPVFPAMGLWPRDWWHRAALVASRLRGLVPPFPWCPGNSPKTGSSPTTSSAVLSYFTLGSF